MKKKKKEEDVLKARKIAPEQRAHPAAYIWRWWSRRCCVICTPTWDVTTRLDCISRAVRVWRSPRRWSSRAYDPDNFAASAGCPTAYLEWGRSFACWDTDISSTIWSPANWRVAWKANRIRTDWSIAVGSATVDNSWPFVSARNLRSANNPRRASEETLDNIWSRRWRSADTCRVYWRWTRLLPNNVSCRSKVRAARHSREDYATLGRWSRRFRCRSFAPTWGQSWSDKRPISGPRSTTACHLWVKRIGTGRSQ